MSIPPGSIFFLDYQYGTASKTMNHYWVTKGTTIMRWDGAGWWNFVTTKNVYYTEEDNVTPTWAQNITRFSIPDKEYSMISVPNENVLHICPVCKSARCPGACG